MNTILAALVNGTVVSAALACTVWMALRLMPRNLLNATTRYAIWWAVLAVTVGLPLSCLRPTQPETAVPSLTPSRTETVHADNIPNARRRVASAMSFRATLSPESAIQPSPHGLSGPVFPIAISIGPWPARVLTLWILTAVLMLTRLASSALLLERCKKRAAEAPPLLAACVADWTTRCGGSKRRIRLAVTREIATPLAAGPWRTAILLPTRLLDDLAERELEQIGIHEAAHLVRGDDYALLIQRTVEAIFVLHPVARWISQRIDLEREIACDDLVITATGDPRPYAACLARVVELSGGVRAMPFTAAAVEDRSHLAKRVEMLLNSTRNATTRISALRLAAALICITGLAWGAAQAPGFIAFAHPAPATRLRAQIPNQMAPVRDMTIAPPSRLPFMAQATPPVSPSTTATEPNTSMVFVPVEVTDPRNRFVTGLDQDVFKIQEDGVDQITTQIAGRDDRADLFVAIGAEVNPDVALEPLLSERIPVHEADDVVQVHGLGHLTPQMPLKSLGSVKRIRQASQRQAMLIVTSSVAAPQHYIESELEDAVRNIDISVYVIDISGSNGPPAPGTGAPPALTFLTSLASRTGGKYLAVKSQEEIPDLLDKIVIELRNMYFLTYTPRNGARDGAYRNLQVTVQAPRGLPNLTVHSRPGYYAPTQ